MFEGLLRLVDRVNILKLQKASSPEKLELLKLHPNSQQFQPVTHTNQLFLLKKLLKCHFVVIVYLLQVYI